MSYCSIGVFLHPVLVQQAFLSVSHQTSVSSINKHAHHSMGTRHNSNWLSGLLRQGLSLNTTAACKLSVSSHIVRFIASFLFLFVVSKIMFVTRVKQAHSLEFNQQKKQYKMQILTRQETTWTFKQMLEKSSPYQCLALWTSQPSGFKKNYTIYQIQKLQKYKLSSDFQISMNQAANASIRKKITKSNLEIVIFHFLHVSFKTLPKINCLH